MDGVTRVSHITWFAGIYKDKKNFFAQFPVEPEDFLAVYPEYVLPPDQMKAWIEDRTGAIVGRQTAEKYGWQIGDRVPIQGTIFRRTEGSTWEFTIRGIYEGDKPGVDETLFVFHYDYFDEARQIGRGLVGWYIIAIDDPSRAVEIAEAIDARFANSRFETKTSTEKAWVQSFADQIGDIGKILRYVLTAVFVTILLVAFNTMAQSVRERTSELGVLKTLGFSNTAILLLVLAESMVLAGLGGFIGLALGWSLITLMGDPTNGLLPQFYIPGRDLSTGVAFVFALGLIAGALPALEAMRLRIVDALRKT
jgi:putative ABC transport system permease protein